MRSKPLCAPFRASGTKPTRINGDIPIAILYQELFTASLHLLSPHFDDEPFWLVASGLSKLRLYKTIVLVGLDRLTRRSSTSEDGRSMLGRIGRFSLTTKTRSRNAKILVQGVASSVLAKIERHLAV